MYFQSTDKTGAGVAQQEKNKNINALSICGYKEHGK